MKKRLIAAALAVIFLLAGCSAPVKHPEWPEDWVRVGDDIGVQPIDGFELVEQHDLMSRSGILYYAWAEGDGRKVTNEDGRELSVYPVQIILLYMRTDKLDEAISDWIAIEKEHYDAVDGAEITGFETLSLTAKSADSTYTGGSAAFGNAPGGAISIEVLTDGGAVTDTILENFISGLHFSE